MTIVDAGVKGKRAVVIGLGASGVAACKLLVSRGAQAVIGTDSKPREKMEAQAAELEKAGVSLALGGHAEARIAEADLVVMSPGVPMFDELAAAERSQIPIWGEIELAVRALAHPAPVVAIGGTNGKSTVTSLVGAILGRAGKRTFVGGNLGEPLADHADEAFDVVVLEVSSFQMERVDSFHPKSSVLLNVSPDHLDRYPSEQAYADAKGNAFLRQTPDDIAVVPAGDDVCAAQARRGNGRLVTFGPGGDVVDPASPGDARLRRIVDVEVQASAIVDHAVPHRYDRARVNLRGGHNSLNVAAAVAAVRPFGIDVRIVEEVLASFRGLPHRMAFVGDVAGVRYYDDSKGTNVGASVTAVRGITEEKVVLVAGGRDKGGSYGPLVDALRDRGRGAVVIGEAADLIARAIGDVVPVRRAASMQAAVLAAAALARAGDAVLLSPACSSFDMFNDYKDRGDAFVRAVESLAEKGARHR